MRKEDQLILTDRVKKRYDILKKLDEIQAVKEKLKQFWFILKFYVSLRIGLKE